MRKKVFTAFSLAAMLLLGSCQKGHDHDHEHAEKTTTDAKMTSSADEWNKLKEDYHMVMSITFHPAEEDQFEPIKKNYEDLVAKAKAWAAADMPEMHQGKGIEAQLQQLVNGAEEVAALVKSEAENEKLKEGLFALHEVFHGIEGACNQMEEHGMQHHHEGHH